MLASGWLEVDQFIPDCIYNWTELIFLKLNPVSNWIAYTFLVKKQSPISRIYKFLILKAAAH